MGLQELSVRTRVRATAGCCTSLCIFLCFLYPVLPPSSLLLSLPSSLISCAISFPVQFPEELAPPFYQEGLVKRRQGLHNLHGSIADKSVITTHPYPSAHPSLAYIPSNSSYIRYEDPLCICLFLLAHVINQRHCLVEDKL